MFFENFSFASGIVRTEIRTRGDNLSNSILNVALSKHLSRQGAEQMPYYKCGCSITCYCALICSRYLFSMLNSCGRKVMNLLSLSVSACLHNKFQTWQQLILSEYSVKLENYAYMQQRHGIGVAKLILFYINFEMRLPFQ